jgi:DNA-binding IclR family transcriptional regulator
VRSPVITPGMRRVLHALAEADAPLTVRALAAATDRSLSTTQHHLQQLKALGLIRHVHVEGYEATQEEER